VTQKPEIVLRLWRYAWELPQGVQNKACKSNGSSSQDQRPDILVIVQGGMCEQQPLISSHTYRIGFQQTYRIDWNGGHV